MILAHCGGGTRHILSEQGANRRGTPHIKIDGLRLSGKLGGWLGGFLRIMSLCGTILQAGTCFSALLRIQHGAECGNKIE